MRLYLADLPVPMDDSYGDTRSYAIATVRYLIEKVENSDDDPALIISEFIKKVDMRFGIIFRVAYETSTDLYDVLFL